MRSVNIYLKIFSLCKGCDSFGEVDGGELGCTNRDGFFDFRTGEYCGGFSPRGTKLRGREARESRKIHDLENASSNLALATNRTLRRRRGTREHAFVRRAGEDDAAFKVREVCSRFLSDVSASFYIKRRTNLAFIASFYINKQLIQHLYKNTHTHTHLSSTKGNF